MRGIWQSLRTWVTEVWRWFRPAEPELDLPVITEPAPGIVIESPANAKPPDLADLQRRLGGRAAIATMIQSGDGQRHRATINVPRE